MVLCPCYQIIVVSKSDIMGNCFWGENWGFLKIIVSDRNLVRSHLKSWGQFWAFHCKGDSEGLEGNRAEGAGKGPQPGQKEIKLILESIVLF